MITSRITAPRRLTMLGAVVLGVMALAGCGSSSSSSSATQTTSPTAAPTRAEFVAKLDEVCARANAKSAAYQNQLTKAANTGDYATAAAVMEQSNRAADPARAELTKLTPPTADATAFARYRAAVIRQAGLNERFVAALKARDEVELKRLAYLTAAERNTRTKAAIDLGTKNCGM